MPEEPEVQAEVQAEEEADDEDEEEQTAAGEAEAAAGAAGGAKKKKKKKKKPKKKQGADGQPGSSNGDAPAAAPAPAKVDKAESERKYQAALSALKSEDLWVDLQCAALSDAKAKKLLEQLKKNDSVTSLNLSQNMLTDEAAKALAAALGASSTVPGLITLDVRENNFTDEGTTILEGLKKARRNLNVMTGPITVPEPVVSAGDKKEKALRDLSDSRLVRKYFQIGNEDDADVAGPAMLPEPVFEPSELWQKLEAAVAQGVPGIPQQQGLLHCLCQQLQNELSGLSGEYSSANSASTPFFKSCLEHLDAFEAILAITPQPVTVQYSSTPQRAVGSHRVLAAEVVAHLLAAHSRLIDHLLAAAQLLPRLLHLALAHPMCSPLHERALRCLRAGLYSQVDALLLPILSEPGWGLQLPALPPLTAPANGASGENGAGPSGLCDPLPTVLATYAATAVGVVGGKRNALMGFVIAASKLLLAAHTAATSPPPAGDSEDDEDAESAPKCSPAIATAISSSAAWQEFSAAVGGVLNQLAHEQEGDLGGPRAVRTPGLLEGAEMPELAGGNMFSGQEILALLHGMGLQRS